MISRYRESLRGTAAQIIAALITRSAELRQNDAELSQNGAEPPRNSPERCATSSERREADEELLRNYAGTYRNGGN